MNPTLTSNNSPWYTQNSLLFFRDPAAFNMQATEERKVIDQLPESLKKHVAHAVYNHNELSLGSEKLKALRHYFDTQSRTDTHFIQQLLTVLIQVTQAVHQIHQAGFVHGALNPDTLLFADPGETKIWLWQYGGQPESYRQHLPNWFHSGLVNYFAPEQSGKTSFSPGYYTDCYALGCIFYELVTQQQAFAGNDTLHVLYQHLTREVDAPGIYNQRIGKGFEQIIVKCLQKNPNKRYQHAGELLEDLIECRENIQAGSPDTLSKHTQAGDRFDADKINHVAFAQERQQLLNIIASGTQTKTGNLCWLYGPSSGQIDVLLKQLFLDCRNKAYWFLSANAEDDTALPYNAIHHVLDQIYHQLLALPNHKIDALSKLLNDRLGLTLPVFISFHPKLNHLFQIDLSNPQNNTENLGRQLRYAFAIFVEALMLIGVQLVFVFNQIDLAPQSTKSIIEGLLQEIQLPGLTLLFTGETLSEWFNQIAVNADHAMRIPINPLNDDETHDLLTQFGCLLQEDKDDLSYLQNLSAGHIPVLIKVLNTLWQQGAIQFDKHSAKWMLQAQPTLEIEDEALGMDSFYERVIEKLPESAYQLIKLSAAWGPIFDPSWIYPMLNTPTPYEETIDLLLRKKLIQTNAGNKNQYRFIHRKIYNILKRKCLPDEYIRMAAAWESNETRTENPINALPLLLQVPPAQCLPFKQHILSAANQAKEIAAFDLYYLAYQHVFDALRLSGNASDRTETLTIGSSLLLASAISGHYNNMPELFEWLKAQTKSKEEELSIYAAYNNALLVKQDFTKSIELCTKVLQEWGIHIEQQPSLLRIIFMSIKTDILMKNKQEADIHQLPLLSNKHQKILIELLQHYIGAAFVVNPKTIPELIYRQSQLSFKYGLSELFSICMACYAYTLTNYSVNFKRAREIQQIADSLNQRFNASNAIQVSQFLWDVFSANRYMNLHEVAHKLLTNYYNCRQLGQVTLGFYNLSFYFAQINYIETPFPFLKQEVDKFLPVVKRQQQDTTAEVLTVIDQYLQYHLDLGVNATDIASYFNHGFNAIDKDKQSTTTIFLLLIENIKDGIDETPHRIEEKIEFLKQIQTQLGKGYYSLIIQKYFLVLSFVLHKPLYLKHKRLVHEVRDLLADAMQYNRANNEARYILIDAIIHYHTSPEAATQRLLKALELCKQQHFRLSAIMACRCLSALCKTAQLERLQHQYILEEYHLLDEFGSVRAKQKIRETYSFLPFNKQTSSFGAQQQSIDIVSFTKASNSISGEIKLDQMLINMLQVLIENAGAQKAYFFIERQNQILLLASKTQDEQIYHPPLPIQNHDFPLNLLRYSLRSGTATVLADAVNDKQFGSEAYFKHHQVKAVCSLPIIKNKEVIGLIYLENNILPGAFTEERLSVLQLLSGQIAVSFENAMLYDEMEQKVSDRTQELQAEKEKSDKLLLNIIPADIAEELKAKGSSEARLYDQVSILLTDFVGFTTIAEKLSPKALVNEIHKHFTAFDLIMEKHGIEKIKTIGDAYLAVCGLPNEVPDHALRIMHAAIEIREYMTAQPDSLFQIRIGIHSGPVVAGIVGVKKYAYDIWGDTVNTAARMEQNSEAGKINISGATYELIQHQFTCHYRGKIQAKNKGEIDMYFVD